MPPTLNDAEQLAQRVVREVKRKQREVVILAGSALTAGFGGRPGVPDVAGMIEIIRAYVAEHEGDDGLADFDRRLAQGQQNDRYQRAFSQVQASLSQDDANAIVRRAVLLARAPGAAPVSDAALAGDPVACLALLDDIHGWALSPGVQALGRLAGHERVARTVLTTNFDPLVEIAIERAGGRRYRTVLHSDSTLVSPYDHGTHVVYLHGYWYGSDTLHTQMQIGQQRRKLADSLRTLLRGKVFLVIGYGGWDDAFMGALADVMEDDHARPDVLWALYESDAAEVTRKYPRLMDPSLHGRGRLLLYGGVDAHEFLPALAERLVPGTAPAASATASATASESAPASASESASESAPASVSASAPATASAPVSGVLEDIHSLPGTGSFLTGRDVELGLLDLAWQSRDTRVFTIVGRGGQGKTALVNHWLGGMRRDGWRGARRVLGWTFYAQGSTQGAGADLFFDRMLRQLGHAQPIASPTERGETLAGLVAAQPTLLIIDGLEPEQAGPGPGLTRGQLRDPGLKVFLRALAARSASGLCVVTTREPVTDLQQWLGQTVESHQLPSLSAHAGSALLRELGARGTDEELAQAVADMDGHALAITLLGTYVRTALRGDIRRRDGVALLTEPRGGDHARRVMAAYERWFGPGPVRAVLYVLGLFDRAATGAEVRALRQAPAIPGLTDVVVELSEADWQRALYDLREARLLGAEDRHDPDGLDAHPLVREYFGERLRDEQPEAWRVAHERLYRHLAAEAPELPDNVHDMRPLFWAVRHGCAAGLHQEVFEQVLRARIDRGNEDFAVKKLGAFGARLGALAHLFDTPLSRPATRLSAPYQAWLLYATGFCLCALGRTSEARAPTRASLDAAVAAEHWYNAAAAASNLSELHQSLGELAQAERLAQEAVARADQSQDAFERMFTRTTLADARLQRGQATAAADLFARAEAMQAERQPAFPMLYSLQGYRYCALLLDRGQALAAGWQVSPSALERAAWSCLPHVTLALPASATAQDLATMRFAQVRKRADYALAGAEPQRYLLDIALDHLTLGRAWLLEAVYLAPADPAPWTQARAKIDQAVRGLRDAGTEDHLPLGLLARAAWHRARLAHPDAPALPAARPEHAAHEHAARDLAEAQELAERGPLKLHLADLALERARLTLALGEHAAARGHYQDARALVDETGYHRRDPELDELATALGTAATDPVTTTATTPAAPHRPD